MTENKKKKLRSLIRFHSANKIDNYNRAGKKGKKIEKNLQNKSKNKNSKCLSWVTAARVLSLAGSQSSSPPADALQPWALHLLWGQLRFQSAPPPMCSGLQCPQLSEPVSFLLWELSMTFYIFHRHRVWLVDPVDLICGLYTWREGFGSSSLATLPLGFSCGFISPSACGSSPGVCSWGCPGGLGFAPVRARCGGGADAWVSGALAAPGPQRGLAARAAGNTVL